MSEGPEVADERRASLPSVSEVKSGIRNKNQTASKNEESFLHEFSNRSVGNERSYVHLKGLTDHYWHKSAWSYFIAVLMFIMIIFQSFLLYKVGIGEWSFEKYAWLLPALLVQNLAQIVGLAVFVVKALFKEMVSD